MLCCSQPVKDPPWQVGCQLFLEHPEEVLARERIMKDVWDTDDLLESRTIDMHVRTLRQKLGAAGEAIRTVRKVGYKLSTEGSDD